LGNRNVEDQDLAGRTGMVSCFGAAGSFLSRFDIWITRLRLKFFGEAATGIEGGRVTYIDGDIDSLGWKCNIRSLH